MFRDANGRTPLLFLALIPNLLFGSATVFGADKLSTIVGLKDGILITNIAFAPNGETLAICCTTEKDNIISSFVNIQSLKAGVKSEKITIARVQGLCHCVAFSPDGDYVVLSQLSIPIMMTQNKPIASAEIVSWHVKERRRIVIADTKKCSAIKLVYSPDRKMIAIGCSDGCIVLRRASNLEIVGAFPGSGELISSLAFSSSGSELISSTSNGIVRVLSLSKKKVIKNLKILSSEEKTQPQLVLSSDGATVVAIGRDRKVKLIDLRTEKIKLSFRQNREIVCCALSKDNKIIALGSKAGNITLYSCVDGKEIAESRLEGEPSSIVLSPDGKSVVVITQVLKSQKANTAMLWIR